MSDNWTGKSSTNWYSNPGFGNKNWSNGVPAISATGTQSVTVNGSATNQPVIAPGNAPSEIVVAQTLTTGGADYLSLTEFQIDGEYITLTNGADLTIQGIAMGVFYGNSGLTAQNATMTGLHGALSTTASYDSHMSLIATGHDTLTVDTVNENFGLISVASGNTLTIYNAIGGNAQQLHGLINYGLITVSTGGHLNITAQGSSGTTVANFYNAGWIEVDGGTLSISSSVLDGANTASTATTTDGYIEIGSGGDAILANTVAATEEVTFTDSAANTLQITAGTLFSGTVNDFGAGDTILVNGFTSTSNATITTVGGVTELITTNGSVLTTITLTGSINANFTTGTNSSGQEIISAGGNTLSSNTTYTAGSSTLTGTGGTLTNNSTVAVTGSGTTVDLASTVTGTGTFFIDNGATLALTNPTGNDAGQTVSFGTNGSVANPNTLLINDNSSGFGGHVAGFGANDDIVLGGSVLPALTSGVGVTESYSGGVLTVSETNASGTVLNTSTVQVAGTGLSTASFVALENGNGINIELAPTASTTYSFSASGTGSFEDYHNYAGGVAPGDTLSPNTTVAIAGGTASVSSGGVTDNGLISIASGAGFVDAGSLSGTGSLSIAAGGAASLTGSTSLGGITDAGTLTLGGTDAVAISLASGAQATLASNFADTSAITGAGTLTVKSGVTGSLAAGSSIGSVLDSGTLNLAGSFAGSINMEGNGANSVVDFNSANAAAQLTNFGTTDDIILGNNALSTPAAGDGLVLSYASATNSLTITETNSSGTVIGTDVVSVTGTASLSSASFVALESSKGINIELAPTAATAYSFSVSGSFEDYHNYAGGVAPGDTLSPNTTVAIAGGTASVSSGGVTDNGLISIASGAGFVDAGSLSGTGSLSIAAGGAASLTGSTTLGGITDAGTLTLGGTDAVAISLASGAQATLASNFADTSAITGAGTLTVKSGVTGSLAAGSSIGAVLDSGTLNLAGSFAGGINMEGNGANSVVDFNSANAAAQLTNFGTTDDIILGNNALTTPVAGDGLVLSYASATNSLTITETNSSGTVIGTDVVSVTGTASLSSGSFVALENGNGINIELAPTASTTYSFSASGTGSFEDYHNYAGGVAPGDTLSPNTTVAIAGGTASVSSGGVTDNGLISIASGAGFVDAGSLSGTGSLSIAAGGAASLTGSTTLGGITDAGTLTLGGTDAVAISLAAGAQATLASNFADTSAITGAGTLTVKSGVTGSLAAGSSIGSVLDSGTLNLAGSFGGSINMEGNGANSVVDFNSANAAAQLTNFGTTDDIILGNNALSTPVAGDGLVLSYASATNSLTITETNSSGTVIGTDVVSVTGTASLSSGSFVALENGNGINIELAPTASTTYSFSVSGSFEDYHNYAGGVAPGDTLSPNTTVAIAGGTASVSSGGVTDNGLISIASGAGFVDAGSLSGTGSLSIAAGGAASLTGSTTLGGITDAGTLTLGGTDAVAISLAAGAQATLASNFADTSAITGAGTLTVKSGVTGSLAAGSSIGSVLDSGTLNLAGSFGGSINMEGNGANSVVDFNSANAAAQLTNFGTTDDIILGNNALSTPVAGDGLVLSYASATNSLTITETNSSGTVIGTDVVSVTGTASLSSGSFVALENGNGINIELAPTASTTYSFSVSGSFEDYHNYAGGVAPGDTLSPNTTVAIAGGTASVSSGGVTDNGLISIASGAGFVDAGSLSGTGSLSIAAGGAASLTGSTTLGGITDAGTLTLGGTDAVAISLAAGAQATLASNFADASAITGAGTLTVKSGVTGSLAAGSSIGSVLDSGTLNLAGSFGGSINMEGNGANSVVDFNSANAAAQLTNFGTTDDIILGNNALTTPVAGDGLVLSYASATNSLTITETNSSGTVIGTDVVSVTGTASLSSGSFVALENGNGINIELAPTASTTYSFSVSGSFEDYHNYAGGVAPGDTLSPNTTVAIAGGTASVSSGGVTDNGLISIASGAGFVDAGSLSGTGSLSIAAGGAASLTGSTTLGGITDAGTLTLGGTDAVAISLAAGAQATLASNFADTSAITGAGTLTVKSGVTGSLAAGSSIGSVLDSGTLNLAGSFGGSINMEGNGANSVADFQGANVTNGTLNTALTNFGTGDELILSPAAFALNSGDSLTSSYSAGELTVTDTTNHTSVTVNLGLTSGDPSSFLEVSDATGQLVITLCFYAGTALATPDGEIKVEDIVAGDMVMTTNGAKTVRWIGQSHVHTRFADPLRALPIRIRQGALGDGLPVRDLLLSPDHAIHIGGILVQASALVNGSTIVREYDVPAQFTYYHVELDSHELLLAEGVEAESFVDNVDRMHFHNWDEREAPATQIAEMDLPRAKSARQVPQSIRNRLGLHYFAVA